MQTGNRIYGQVKLRNREPDKMRPVTRPELCGLELLFTLLDLFPCHSSSQDCIPVNEERLREIGLDPDSLRMRTSNSEHTNATSKRMTNLVMNVVIVSIVAAEHLEWVKGKTIPAVIIDRFHGAERK